jgi:hypothetical protein
MRHARADYNRFQDPAGLIPEDEPVFLLRAQDANAAVIVRLYAQRAQLYGAAPEFVRRCLNWADVMEAWPNKKTPDMPQDA